MSGSSDGSRRRAIAIDRVRCPSPVPFEVTKRNRLLAKAFVGLDQRPRDVVSLPLQGRQRALVLALDANPAHAPKAILPAREVGVGGIHVALEEGPHPVVIATDEVRKPPEGRVPVAFPEF